MNHVVVSLQFAGVLLPVAADEQGGKVVPLKPISDALGLEWVRQHKRSGEAGRAQRLGTCTVPMYYAGQTREMVCIRLDRVVAWLFSINPEAVRGQGNVKAAEFLEQKQAEWDTVLHDYEAAQGMFGKELQAEARKRVALTKLWLEVIREHRRTEDAAYRQRLVEAEKQLASELGLPFQPQLVAA